MFANYKISAAHFPLSTQNWYDKRTQVRLFLLNRQFGSRSFGSFILVSINQSYKII
jgi:hypothetical protein